MKKLMILLGLLVGLTGCGNFGNQQSDVIDSNEDSLLQQDEGDNKSEEKGGTLEENNSLTDEEVLQIIEETLATFNLGDGIKGVSDYYTNVNYDNEPYAIVILESIYEDMFFTYEGMSLEKCQELYDSTILVANDLFDTLIQKLEGYEGYFVVSVSELSGDGAGNNMNIGYVSNQDKQEGQKFVVSNVHMYSDYGIEIETIDGHY